MKATQFFVCKISLLLFYFSDSPILPREKAILMTSDVLVNKDRFKDTDISILGRICRILNKHYI